MSDHKLQIDTQIKLEYPDLSNSNWQTFAQKHNLSYVPNIIRKCKYVWIWNGLDISEETVLRKGLNWKKNKFLCSNQSVVVK